MAIASAMPPIPATSGRAKRRRSRSSPRSNSRRASSPTTKKKNVISPLFTQWRRSSATPASPMSIESFVLQSEPYDDASTFTQTSAAAAAASKTAAPPVSVRRNSRSGVCTLRAQAVRPENGDGRLLGSPSALAALTLPHPDDVGRSLDRCHLNLLPSGSVQQPRPLPDDFCRYPFPTENAERLPRLPERR